MRGPATTIMRSAGTRSFASGKAAITRRGGRADARAADRDDADLLVGAVAELGSQRGAVGELLRIEAGDVARER